MKCLLRRIFCFHDYEKIESNGYRIFNTWDGERSENPDHIERRTIYKCKKCGKYKVIKLKI